MNSLGIVGLSFVELTTYIDVDSELTSIGLSKCRCKNNDINIYYKDNIRFIVKFKSNLKDRHHKSDVYVSALGIKVKNTNVAISSAVGLGAKKANISHILGDFPCIYFIDTILVYFTDDTNEKNLTNCNSPIKACFNSGIYSIDHITIALNKGFLDIFSNFMISILNFSIIGDFYIVGSETSLKSIALLSPCKSFSIPLVEAGDENPKNQINKCLGLNNGSGVQHIAFITNNIFNTLDQLKNKIKIISINEGYYKNLVIKKNNIIINDLQRRNILLDEYKDGYLLQTFSQDIFKPIFFEFVERNNYRYFGDGNFQKLFESLE